MGLRWGTHPKRPTKDLESLWSYACHSGTTAGYPGDILHVRTGTVDDQGRPVIWVGPANSRSRPDHAEMARLFPGIEWAD